MAIENTYLLGKNITLGCGFDLQAKAPLDSRQTVPAFAGLQALITGNAAYEGMIVYDEETKKTYQAQIIDGVLAFREFGMTEQELRDFIAAETTAAMEFKGAASALPANPTKGDFYKVTASFKVGEEDAKIGDSIVYDGANWFLIPSGDDIEDTWRPVTDVNNDATLTFVAGDKLEKTVAADGTITYKHVAIDAPTATPVGENEQTRTYIASIETDGHGHITGYKTATENVEDTNTTYTFEGQGDEATSVYFQVKSSEEEDAEVIYLDAYSKNEANLELAKKVDKVEGYSLVSDTEIARLAEVDNYDDEEVRGLIGDNAKAIEDLESYVGTVPTDDKYKDLSVVAYINKKAEETLAAAQGGSSETAASVKQQLDNYKSENDTRVKAAEDAIDAIEADYLKAADKTELSNAIAGVKTTAEAAATKEYTDAELAKKVDKVDGKSLIADTEIARLANVTNYDDTKVKEDIAKKADVETMTTELGKKVDKVTGYSLVADTEIERLSKVNNYDDTALAGKVTNLENNSVTKTELQNVDDKFANYVTSEALDETLAATAEFIYTKEEADGKFLTAVDGIPGPDANPMAIYVCPTAMVRLWFVHDKETEDQRSISNGIVYILQVDELPETGIDIGSSSSALAAYFYQLKSDTSKIYSYTNLGGWHEASDLTFDFTSYSDLVNIQFWPYGEHQRTQLISDFRPMHHICDGTRWMPVGSDGAGNEAENFLRFAEREYTYTKEETDTAVQGAKDYAKGLVDAIPAQTDYTVTIDEDTTDSTIAKRYIFKQLGQEIGRIDLAKELVVTSGTVKEVTIADMPYAGAVVGDKYIELVIANQTTPIYVPAKDLVDIYTAAAGATEVQVAINNTNEISATLVNGGVTEAKLHADVAAKLNKTWEEVGVAKGLVDALADGQVKTNTGAIAAINNTSTGILAQAKGYADTKKNEAIAAAKTETENQVKALAGEGNTSTVKKNADDIATLFEMFQWGEF